MIWAQWYSDHSKRRVAEDYTRFYRLSSVFLGIDHNFSENGPPLLFETMLFEREATIKLFWGKLRTYNEEAFSDQDETQWRFATWDDTYANHQAILRRLLKQEAVAEELARKHNFTLPPKETDEERLERDANAAAEGLTALSGESFQAKIVRPPKK